MFILNKELANKLCGDAVRIVAANQHHNTGEIEIVLEIREQINTFKDKLHLVSFWIDKMDIIKKIANIKE